MTNCLFFGDSITYGEYDGVLGGWVDNLKRYLHSKYYNENAKEINAYNLGVGGETTDGLLKRLEIEIQARKSPDENLIFFLYGANDLAIIEGREILTLDKFEANIHKAIDLAKKHTEHVFVISILPISKNIDGITVSSGKLRTNERIILFNQKLEEISSQKSIKYISVHSIFSKNTENLFSKDGVHPNEKGYELISDSIRPIIEKYL